MQPNLEKRSIPVARVAFLQRAFARSLGIYKNPGFGVDIQKRAGCYLLNLSKDEKSLTFKIALENLRRESELLDEESALLPEGLELKRKVVELADRYEIAAELVKGALTQSPVAKLVLAIFTEAKPDPLEGCEAHNESHPESHGAASALRRLAGQPQGSPRAPHRRQYGKTRNQAFRLATGFCEREISSASGTARRPGEVSTVATGR